MPGNSRVNNGGAFGDGLFLRQGSDACPERLATVKVAVLAPSVRGNEIRMLDLDDVRWELGRFGKLNVRYGMGARRAADQRR